MVYQKFNEDEVKNLLIYKENVVYSYILMNEDGNITDFFSFYQLCSTILKDPDYNELKAAYSL